MGKKWTDLHFFSIDFYVWLTSISYRSDLHFFEEGKKKVGQLYIVIYVENYTIYKGAPYIVPYIYLYTYMHIYLYIYKGPHIVPYI